MANTASIISRSPWQTLLRTTARPRARLGLLNRQARSISSEVQARPSQLSSVHPQATWLFENVGDVIKCIDPKSLPECKEPVRVVASETECLCSWNEANGPNQAIQVPGDASRPRTASLLHTEPTSNGSLHPPRSESPPPFFNSSGVSRKHAWDDALASLCAEKPNAKLDDADVMVNEYTLGRLLGIAFWRGKLTKNSSMRGFALDLSLIDKTLVIQHRLKLPRSPKIPSPEPPDWDCYKASTVPVPGVENGSRHNQILRHKIGPLSCVVRTGVHGTVQDLPIPSEHTRPPKTRDIHGIDVITAGHGVLPFATFQGIVRPQKTDPRARWEKERDRQWRWAPHLWVNRQTKLGIADFIPPGADAAAGGLTVVELGELVSKFEEKNQDGLRRLVGLLEILRDTVRAHGAPCVVIFHKPRALSDSGSGPTDYTIQIHSAGPEEVPVLLDWHKKHFWSRNKDTNEPSRSQDEAVKERA